MFSCRRPPLMFMLVLLLLLWASTVTSAMHELELSAKQHACYREVKPRGPALLPTKRECPEGYEKEGLICYPKCTPDFVGQGPLCWASCAKHKYPHEGGFLFCCETPELCKTLVDTVGKALPRALLKLAFDIATSPQNVVKLLMDFRRLVETSLKLALPQCHQVTLQDLVVM